MIDEIFVPNDGDDCIYDLNRKDLERCNYLLEQVTKFANFPDPQEDKSTKKLKTKKLRTNTRHKKNNSRHLYFQKVSSFQTHKKTNRKIRTFIKKEPRTNARNEKNNFHHLYFQTHKKENRQIYQPSKSI